MTAFHLEHFEHLVYSRQHEPATQMLLALLKAIDGRYGALGLGFSYQAASGFSSSEDVDTHVFTRIAGAISCLVSETTYTITDDGWKRLIIHQRWISAIFSASAYRNADHVLRGLNANGGDLRRLQIQQAAWLRKFCLMFGADSDVALDFDALWQIDRQLTVSLLMAQLSPRFMGTPVAHQRREKILEWLPARLDELDSLDALPDRILHDVYMHCSYADLPAKHEIKRGLHRLVRRKLIELGVTDLPAPPRPAEGEKPVLLVVLDWFSERHSIYRTHSTSIRAARRHFHVIGMGMAHLVDSVGREVFDEFEVIDFEGVSVIDQVRQIRRKAEACRAQVLYQPGVGMFPHTIFAASLRLAPLQFTALGHSASTLSPQIDYFAVDEDFIGDASTFSERLLRLPPGVMPMVPSAGFDPERMKPVLRPQPEVVRIAVAASTMKLNPRFLACCRRIADSVRTPVHFEILAGQAIGLVYLQARNTVRSLLGERATLHMSQAYEPYMETIGRCDLFINPFPYGNMNGMADMAALGMVGVCMGGPQVHQEIDAGLFKRLGLPDWSIARDLDAYVAAAVRLVDQPEERLALRRQLIERGGPRLLNQGDPDHLGCRVLELWQQQTGAAGTGAQAPR
ncbi:MAG: peptide transporter [Curvibacter sp.]|nr:peptide transporter [Curvibacter sp.]